MDQVSLIIDNLEVKTKGGGRLLWAALDNGLYIPNLCAIRQAEIPWASCRLCFVKVEGKTDPVTACTEPVRDGMVVHLNTPEVNKLRSIAFELLLTNHKIDCRNCDKNRNCELQNIAARCDLKLKLRRFRLIPRELPVDSSHPLFTYNPNRCVLCGKCVWVCNKLGTGILDFAYQGINTMVSTFASISLADAGCNLCLACVAICPVGAIVAKSGVCLEEAKALVAQTI